MTARKAGGDILRKVKIEIHVIAPGERSPPLCLECVCLSNQNSFHNHRLDLRLWPQGQGLFGPYYRVNFFRLSSSGLVLNCGSIWTSAIIKVPPCQHPVGLARMSPKICTSFSLNGSFLKLWHLVRSNVIFQNGVGRSGRKLCFSRSRCYSS